MVWHHQEARHVRPMEIKVPHLTKCLHRLSPNSESIFGVATQDSGSVAHMTSRGVGVGGYEGSQRNRQSSSRAVDSNQRAFLTIG